MENPTIDLTQLSDTQLTTLGIGIGIGLAKQLLNEVKHGAQNDSNAGLALFKQIKINIT